MNVKERQEKDEVYASENSNDDRKKTFVERKTKQKSERKKERK